MYLLAQPCNGQLGSILKEQMLQPFNKLTIVSAFAKTSGVLRLKKEIMAFKEKNNAHIAAFIGIDTHGTSIEALQNLFDICNELYVVHSDNGSTTFHPKIYAFENEYKIWMAVGSNNLTGGGLWTNFESSIVCKFPNDAGDESYAEVYKPLTDLIMTYKDPSCEYSMKIVSEQNIKDLADDGYIWEEHRIIIDGKRNQMSNAKTDKKSGFSAKKVASSPNMERDSAQEVNRVGANVAQKESQEWQENKNLGSERTRLWMETGQLTGASANQLEPSANGTLIGGSASGTIFNGSKPGHIKGSIVYFGIEPNAVSASKNITINYCGMDYAGCSVEHKSGNSNWRIVLKGKNKRNKEIQRQGASGWLKNKILIFERIADDYYLLTVCDESVRSELEKISVFWGANGNNKTYKKYGLI